MSARDRQTQGQSQPGTGKQIFVSQLFDSSVPQLEYDRGGG